MTSTSKPSRISSIDVLRGLVMLIMLIDHVRERFYLHQQVADPMDIQATDPSLFFTRLSAHLCAPIFVFLTGLSAWLYANPKTGAPRPVGQFLLKRGLLLIALEMTVVNFSWFGAYHTLYLQVIWAIGISMISLAALSYLPRLWIGVIGALIVFGHNALTPISFAPDETGYWLWTILHDRDYLVTDAVINVRASYPVLPWIGVIALGYFAGPLFKASLPSSQRKSWLVALGLSALACLLLLRGFNIYGETVAWQSQANLMLTTMDFLNFTKYPPSLDFLLFTVGIGLLLLAVFEHWSSPVWQILRTFGRAPMFFYIVHLYVLLLLYWAMLAAFGPNVGDYFGFNAMWQIWLMTATLGFAMYFPTRAFGRYKHQGHSTWAKYF
ncbi:DUF1624 domain-containing protein [Echinimonas agarilytica]|uniref:Heparan-alpha-glucosaminide N-acetyltransferase domain-containing protein n=1 Tax=Echinimonas agarilytica TaxID=1215918 RepID=A0AA41W7C8_9GAMM|nr:heparan-alpha-glucosaminide N-acetyltransferase domain-containing protein [Echinimonas agarilytica]MCM2680314.1 heparan-alpha-glucosaminide N-acetyltransferase domain-containing protein [Echinimonas agarilytica]